jgi:hypothetical protein
MGAQPINAIAGRGIIRVVGRCEDAKENSNLGEYLIGYYGSGSNLG